MPIKIISIYIKFEYAFYLFSFKEEIDELLNLF